MDIKKRRDKCNTILDVVLANTGYENENDFLFPEKAYNIDRLDDAVELVKKAIKSKQNIHIFADYDADGITSAAILEKSITAKGGKVDVRLPKRFSEGYGISIKAIDDYNDGLLITVDNGIAAYDAIEVAKAKGLTVIIIDHHLAPEDGRIPNADVVIDPNAIKDSADFNSYCGAGLSYKFAIALLGKEHKLIQKLVSFAAIGTVADVMPLVEENRIIVKQGLKSMVTYAGRTTGLGALLEKCNMDNHISEKDIGFKIGPIINAAGRLFDDGAKKSFDVISFNGAISKAKELAEELYEINEKRKELKETGIEIVTKVIEDECLFGDNPLIVYKEGLPEGLAGIYAGQLAEEYKVPCFVLTNSDDSDIIKGSGRTYGGVNIKELLDKNAKYLYKHGGHAEAAGISLKKENLDDFRIAMIESAPEVKVEDVIYYDLEIESNDIESTLNELQKYAPFGEGNKEIVFLIKDFMLSPRMKGCFDTLGADNQHLKLFGVNANGIGFNMAKRYNEIGQPKKLNIVCTLSTNYFMGRASTQVELINIENASTEIKKTDMASLLANMAKARYS